MSYQAAADRYSSMNYRRTGKSGLKLPELSLGLWHNFGTNDSMATQRAILRRAFDLGITHFDLANNYGPVPGSAEENFGIHLDKDFRPYRDELIISTKAGYDMWPGPYGEWGSRKYLLASLDQSLKRMNLDYVDIFYSHRFDPNTPLEETMGALATAVHSGRALYAGISSYDAEQTRQAKAILESKGVPLLIHQPRYSMFDRTAEKSLFDTLGAEGIGSIVFSPLAQGLLSDRYLGGVAPKGSRAALNHFLKAQNISDDYLMHANALNEIAKQRGQTLSQLALSWVLRQPTVTSALIGVSSVKQLEQNVATLSSPKLSLEEIRAIEPHAIHGLGLN
ncbi:L-glyceraldehyde 3-phosphate reductase [Rhodoluna limnophila]|uniref:L-glyceraldehyde 3-phosphate reductase n=1 Tax=Rhodoluna limnophila TaxID=232537 RepID=UPI001106C508|nr:L-glyceraldehyde 3-phosphate reductase [Rhodoluna limnophila]